MASIIEYSSKIRQKLTEIYESTIGRLFSEIFGKPRKVLFLGIDNAGKTTLVNRLKNNSNHVFLPTKHPNKDEVQIGSLKAVVFDLGGHKVARKIWKDYFGSIDGIIFIVDTSSEGRFTEVREAWEMVQSFRNGAPVAVLMNKIDLIGESSQTICMNPTLMAGLENQVGIQGLTAEQDRVKPFYLSIVNEDVFDRSSTLCQAFEWLGKTIKEKGAQTNWENAQPKYK